MSFTVEDRKWEARCKSLESQLAEVTKERDQLEVALEEYKQAQDVLVHSRDQWYLACENLREALKEISEGKGRYSLDQFEHCRNTVEDMKALANEALAAIEGKGEK